jgi:hypothetical protein
MILLEYLYRDEIDDLIHQFKQQFNPKKRLSFKPPMVTIYDEEDDDDAEVDIWLTFIPNKNLEWAFDIDAAKEPRRGKHDIIKGKIEFNPTQFPGAMGELESELIDMFRHEFEHVAQDAFDSKWVKYVAREPRDPRYYVGYLLQGNEIPAYLRGFETVVERTGKSLEEVMEAWYKNNKKNFKKDSYWKIVKGMWLRHAKRMKIKGLKETIKKVDGKYAVYPEKGGKRLGTHSSKKQAQAQLTAIEISKAKRGK